MNKSPFPKVKYADPSGFEGSALRILSAVVNGARKMDRVDVSNLVQSDNAQNDE